MKRFLISHLVLCDSMEWISTNIIIEMHRKLRKYYVSEKLILTRTHDETTVAAIETRFAVRSSPRRLSPGSQLPSKADLTLHSRLWRACVNDAVTMASHRSEAVDHNNHMKHAIGPHIICCSSPKQTTTFKCVLATYLCIIKASRDEVQHAKTTCPQELLFNQPKQTLSFCSTTSQSRSRCKERVHVSSTT
jgi:hypothetical protein